MNDIPNSTGSKYQQVEGLQVMEDGIHTEWVEFNCSCHIRTNRLDVIQYIAKLKSSRKLSVVISEMFRDMFEQNKNIPDPKGAFTSQKLEEIIKEKEEMQDKIEYLTKELEKVKNAFLSGSRVTAVNSDDLAGKTIRNTSDADQYEEDRAAQSSKKSNMNNVRNFFNADN